MTDSNGTLDAMGNPDTTRESEVAGVVDVPLATLKPHPRNPRKIRPERLEQLKRNLIAAETLGRRCFAMEIDPRYCDVIRRRYATFTDQPDLAP